MNRTGQCLRELRGSVGFFKDVRGIMDISQEVSAEKFGHRKLPWWRTLFPFFHGGPGLIKGTHMQAQAVGQARAMQVEAQRQQRLLATGTPGKATVRGLQSTGTVVNFNPEVVLDLEVTVEGKAAYLVQLTTSVPQVYVPMAQPGRTISVRVDPNDPSTMGIDWARA